jgi:hypothetical protein
LGHNEESIHGGRGGGQRGEASCAAFKSFFAMTSPGFLSHVPGLVLEAEEVKKGGQDISISRAPRSEYGRDLP